MGIAGAARQCRAIGKPHAVIVLRDSQDWARLDHSYLDTTTWMDQILGRPPGFTKSFIELWDATFNVPFFEVRHELKQIAQRTLFAVRDAEVVPVSAVTRWPPAGLMFFTDDDDWYAPDIVASVTPYSSGRDCVSWPAWRFNGWFVPRDDVVFASNGYAVTARAPLGRNWRPRVFMHGRAYTTVARSALSHCEVPSRLSVLNRHPASAIAIRDAITELPGRDGLVASMDDYLERAEAPRPTPRDAVWAEGPATATLDLFKRVRRR